MITNGIRRAATLAFAACLGACSAAGPTVVNVNSAAGQTITVSVGAELDITLQVIGPGIYASPPAVSSSAVRFLGESEVSPAVPAGPTQKFRFACVAVGVAIVDFANSVQTRTVEDTIVVR